MRLPVLLAFFALCACANTQYQPYYGKNDIVEGKGGTMKSYEGIEFWENGDPPKKYKILGVINDSRADALIPYLTAKKDIVKKVKEAKGDATILLEDFEKITGYSGEMNYSGQINVSADSTKIRKYLIIKYLD